MKEVIHTDLQHCVGCNRCVRKCPMELANITYLDEAENIKVKIDFSRCINCGRCVSACRHEARIVSDDTIRFFEDLSNGIPISLIAAPSIRTNIAEYKRLFTFLKTRGVKKIYDVALGADICVWAHIRHIEQSGGKPLITQPCPAIVSYCRIYRPDLLEHLSPVQSPMACVVVYMKEFEGISDNIAALSPCFAKADESEDTGLTQYNVTFLKLMEYLEEQGIELPDEETEFDHYQSALGVLFPVPGGLKENVEAYFGKSIHVSKAEGFNVYEKLNSYNETDRAILPEVFDVLNCIDGCSMGPASCHGHSVYEVDNIYYNARKVAEEKRDPDYLKNLYKKYDETLQLSSYMRGYTSIFTENVSVTDEAIEQAFISLGKTTDEKKKVDCGACGSETCYSMARKIALQVNIPENCIVHGMETAKEEHEMIIAANEQLALMERQREADEQMQLMFDKTPLGAQLWDKNSEMTTCNQESLELFNVPSKEEFIERFYELSPEFQPDGKNSREASLAWLQKAFKTGYERFEWMHQKLDGEPVPAEIILVRVTHRGEELVASYTRDLREQKRMIRDIEIRDKKTEDALLKLESAQVTVSSMFESNPHMNLLFNDKLQLVDCNPAASAFLGFDTKEEMLEGFSQRMLAGIPEFQSDGRRSIPMQERLLATIKQRHIVFETELSYGGTTRIINIEMKKIPYEDSFAIVAYVFDITDIREREKELIQRDQQLLEAVEEARTANQAKSAFLSTVSHEIRTPMNAILGITEIQLQKDGLDSRLREAFGKIYNSGNLLLGIINDILDLSKIEAGRLDLVLSNYDFASMVNDTVHVNMMRIGSKPIEFKLVIDENIPSIIIGDELRVKQILNNVLSNAFKYTQKGFVELSVSVEPYAEDDSSVTLIFVVRDTGQGMTKEQVDSLYDEYSRFNLKTNRTTEGIGLGMSITKNLLNMMNGEIFAKSEPGVGSVFTIRLPQKYNGAQPLGKEHAENLQCLRLGRDAELRRAQIVREPMPYGSVLIVDDVETNLYVARGILDPYQLNIDTADSGMEAIEKIDQGKVYDIIFMDHMMPKMDGIETTEILRAKGYRAPIVALTANAVVGQADLFLKKGFEDFISKPIDLRQINDVLNRLIRDKQPPEVIEEVRRQNAGKTGCGSAGDGATDTIEAPVKPEKPARQALSSPEKPDKPALGDPVFSRLKQKPNASLPPRFFEIFARDAAKVVKALEDWQGNPNAYGEEAIKTYGINVHGIKSALASIGLTELSAYALKLEKAARENDFEILISDTSGFLDELRILIDEFAPKTE